MIKYNLVCKVGHEFEGWFRNSEAFKKQKDAEQLQCAICGNKDISKGLMTPNLGPSTKSGKKAEASPETPLLQKEIVETIRKLHDHVTKNADYVGSSFAEEARKIHYEETEPRDIYGEATSTEVKELAEEGVDFQPIPPLPEDKN